MRVCVNVCVRSCVCASACTSTYTYASFCPSFGLSVCLFFSLPHTHTRIRIHINTRTKLYMTYNHTYRHSYIDTHPTHIPNTNGYSDTDTHLTHMPTYIHTSHTTYIQHVLDSFSILHTIGADTVGAGCCNAHFTPRARCCMWHGLRSIALQCV